jgi:hypothetical protein
MIFMDVDLLLLWRQQIHIHHRSSGLGARLKRGSPARERPDEQTSHVIDMAN